MKNKLIIIILALIVILPVIASAYTLLQPLPESGDPIGKTTVIGLSDYLTWLYRFALGAVIFLAVLKIVIGGVLIIVGGAKESAQSEGRGMIEMALWGLLLALCAWLLLNVINPDFVKGKFGLEPVTIERAAPTAPPVLPPAPGTLSNQQAKLQLNAAMVGYKSNVSFEGIRQATINEAKALSFDLQNKGIGIGNEYITSGTEGSHNEGTYSHANGYKFDLRKIDQLTNFIQNNYTRIQDRIEKDGTKIPQYQNSRGAIYAKENNHWDVLVK